MALFRRPTSHLIAWLWRSSTSGKRSTQQFVCRCSRFDLSHVGHRLQPYTLYPSYETDRKSGNIFELDEIQGWWRKGLALSLTKLSAIEEKIRFDPFKNHGARKVAQEFASEFGGALHAMRSFGLHFRPVTVDGDGSCESLFSYEAITHAPGSGFISVQPYAICS
jgi:hypothetical protein